jgi:hypothetical protein
MCKSRGSAASVQHDHKEGSDVGRWHRDLAKALAVLVPGRSRGLCPNEQFKC